MLTLVGGGGIILLGGSAILFGLNSKLSSLQSVAVQKELEVGSSEQIAKRYQQTQENFNETSARIQYLESAVTPKSYVPTLLKQLQTLAQTTQLTVTAVRPGMAPPPPAPVARTSDGSSTDAPRKVTAPPPYDVIPIDVDIIGTYANTANFLYSLTRFPKIVAVVGAQMRPGGLPAGASPMDSPQVTTNLHLVAYIFHEESAAAQGAPVTPADITSAQSPVRPTAPVDVSKIEPAAGRVERGALNASQISGSHLTEARVATGNSSL